MTCKPTVQTPIGLAALEVASYTRGGRPAVLMTDATTGEPIGMISTNLLHAPDPGEGCTFIKTWSENELLVDSLLASGLFVDTGRRVPAGHAQAAVWKLSGALAEQYQTMKG